MELYDDDRPTLRTVLGERMRRMRQDEGLSLREFADQIHMPFGFLGRVERGEQEATETLVTALDRRWDTAGLFADLLVAAQEMTIPDYSRDFTRKERDTVRIQVFASSLIPGLLQTADYARELFRTGLVPAPREEIEKKVAFRMKRQRIFDRDEPPFYWAIMDEAALRRPIADRRAMKEQVAHILNMAERPHITVQVMPFDRGLYSMMGGCLTIYTMRNGTSTAQVESFGSALPVDSPQKVVRELQRFDAARSMALTEDESLGLIREYLKEYEHERDS
jgi:transcriptional regulator with XRE-family HTH domain